MEISASSEIVERMPQSLAADTVVEKSSSPTPTVASEVTSICSSEPVKVTFCPFLRMRMLARTGIVFFFLPPRSRR